MADKTCKVCGRVIPDGHICLSCGDYDDMQRFTAAMPKTNGDRIRAMTDEQLAAIIGRSCMNCIYRDEPECDSFDCYDGKLSYLKQEVQNE